MKCKCGQEAVYKNNKYTNFKDWLEGGDVTLEKEWIDVCEECDTKAGRENLKVAGGAYRLKRNGIYTTER